MASNIKSLYRMEKPVDIATLSVYLDKMQKLENAGRIQYIKQIIDNNPEKTDIEKLFEKI